MNFNEYNTPFSTEPTTARRREFLTKVFGFLMGQANRQLKGAATPAAIKAVLEKKLNE